MQTIESSNDFHGQWGFPEHYLSSKSDWKRPRYESITKHKSRHVVGGRHEVGTLKGYPGKDLIRNLPSFLSEEYKLKEGEPIGLTVDFLTTPGSIMLMHSEAEQVEKDAAYIHEISKPGGGLYDITPLNKFRLRSF